MLDTPLAIANGGLCAAAIAFAAHVPKAKGRREALCLAVVLAANFIFCALGYTGFAPKLALRRIGVELSTKELWAIADAIFGCLTAFAFVYWWAWVLWAGALAHVLLHGFRIYFDLDEFAYTDSLQIVLLAQIAIFFLIGGRGVGNRVHRGLDNCRLYWRACASAFARRSGK